MRYLACLLFLVSNLIYSQNIEIYGGLSLVQGFPYKYTSFSKFNNNAVIGILSGFKVGKKELKFGLSYESYSGNFRVSDGGPGSGASYIGNYKNHSVSLDFYPLNIRKKRTELSFGIKTSFRIESTLDGLYKVHHMGNEWSSPLFSSRGSKFIAGLQMLVAFPLSIGEKWNILPQLHFYHGFTKDYIFGGSKFYKRWISPQIGIRKTF